MQTLRIKITPFSLLYEMHQSMMIQSAPLIYVWSMKPACFPTKFGRFLFEFRMQEDERGGGKPNVDTTGCKSTKHRCNCICCAAAYVLLLWLLWLLLLSVVFPPATTAVAVELCELLAKTSEKLECTPHTWRNRCKVKSDLLYLGSFLSLVRPHRANVYAQPHSFVGEIVLCFVLLLVWRLMCHIGSHTYSRALTYYLKITMRLFDMQSWAKCGMSPQIHEISRRLCTE